YKYREQLGEQTIAENREEGSFIWENYYDEESMINEYNLTLFERETSDLYRKYEETHYQRAYRLSTIEELVECSGLELLHIYDAFTREPPREDSERVYVICRRCAEEGGEDE
ncbi:MAG: class I SAM-dependent methyltransferase, partial [Lachnospiraceae bacterium]|nr:class I SAM-dependent methyltransferase [Lachnospiraceae bacterium]